MKRFNFTGRQRIYRESFMLATRLDAGRLVLDSGIDLDQYALPEDARVTLHIRVTGVRTWDTVLECGVVGTIRPGRRFNLPQHYSGHRLSGQVVVTLGDSAKILARSAEANLRFDEEADVGSESVLPVGRGKLVGELWRLNTADYDVPTLIISDEISDEHAFLQQPSVQALIFPTVMREIISWLVEEKSSDDITEGIVSQWITVLRNAGTSILDYDLGNLGDGREEIINTIASEFCRTQEFVVKFLKTREPLV